VRPHVKAGHRVALCALLVGACFELASGTAFAQAESVSGGSPLPDFAAQGRVEGHLAVSYSPAGAFSPDSRNLAVVVTPAKIVLMDLQKREVGRILRPEVPPVIDLEIESANFLSPDLLFVLARGGLKSKGSDFARRTPLLAYQWDVGHDTLSGKVEAVGADGGLAPILYLPHIGYLGMYKESKFSLWSPKRGGGSEIVVPELAHKPGTFAFSPDAHWLLLGHVEANASPDPIVVDLTSKKFADVLTGHKATVLSISFSRAGDRVVTACEDGKVRIFSAPDWKLLQTLGGHNGPVHWAEFSPDGRLVASAGEDRTLRIWSAADGRLLQTLQESREPLLSVAFSPDGNYVAASAEDTTFIWGRTE
jgi:WD40 repeat protein